MADRLFLSGTTSVLNADSFFLQPVTNFSRPLARFFDPNPRNTMQRPANPGSTHPETVHVQTKKGKTRMMEAKTTRTKNRTESSKAPSPAKKRAVGPKKPPSLIATTTPKVIVPVAPEGTTGLPKTGIVSTTLSTPLPASPLATPPVAAAPAPTFISLDVAAGPPDVSIPPVPGGFEKSSMRPYHGSYPRTAELAAMPMVLADLSNFTDYATVLGSAAPDPTTLMSDLTVGLAWRSTRNASEAWTEYVKVADAMAWQAVTPALDALKPAFALALAKDPTLASKYRGLAALFSARKATAQAAVTTKQKKAKAKAVAQSAASTAAQTVAAAPAPSPKVTITT
jgi:hypothetical protein